LGQDLGNVVHRAEYNRCKAKNQAGSRPAHLEQRLPHRQKFAVSLSHGSSHRT
jgi:hypothetical protein